MCLQILQDGRFGKVEQEDLSSTCKINKDLCLARISKIEQDFLARLTKIDQDHGLENPPCIPMSSNGPAFLGSFNLTS